MENRSQRVLEQAASEVMPVSCDHTALTKVTWGVPLVASQIMMPVSSMLMDRTLVLAASSLLLSSLLSFVNGSNPPDLMRGGMEGWV